MFLKRSRSGRSTNRFNSIIHEPEPIRLQRDIERISERLEYEKRESNYLDERISMMNHELTLMKHKETQPKKTNSKSSSLKSNLDMLEKRLEFETIQLNEAIASNKKIRSTIDSYRLEKLSYKRSLICLKEDLLEYSKQAEQKNFEYRRGEQNEQEEKKKISILRCKSASEQCRFGEKISHLNSCLVEEKHQRSKIFKIMESEVRHNINKPIEGIQVSRILKIVLERWGHKTKEKKRSLDGYLKYIKSVEEAFKQIKEATGISYIEDIVVAVIKTQEQNHEIYSYMNTLNSEIDVLEEILRSGRQKIAAIEKNKENEEKSKTEISQNLEKEAKKVDNKSEIKLEKIKEYRQQILATFPSIQKMVSIFKKLKITPQLNRKFENSWLEYLSEENIMNSLGYVEEFVNYMVILLAYLRNSRNPILGHNILNSISDPQEHKTMQLQDLIDDKDLYEDRELDDCKKPIPLNQLQTRARLILENSKSAI